MPQNETLGRRIKRIRTERGMSRDKVVRDDFSRAFLNQVELGKARPSIRVLRIIADRLGTEVEDILEGHEAGIERELALEKGRVLLARVETRRAMLALKPAVASYDWPLGSDARVCRAQALLVLGRKDEADEVLAREKKTIELHNDRPRLDRLSAAEPGEGLHFEGDPVEGPPQLANRGARPRN